MRVLVLGGTKFIGPAVVERLRALGHGVTLFHRGKTGADRFPGLPRVLGDRHRLAESAAVLRAARPDAVVDMLPLGATDARAVVDLFRGVVARLVAVGSADVYRAFGVATGIEEGPADPVADAPLAEDAPLRATRFPYRGRAPGLDDYEKIHVEEAVLGARELPGTVLRLPMVYGPGDPQHRFGPVVRRILDGRPAFLLDEDGARWRCSRASVADVAAAIVLAACDGRPGSRLYNVAEPDAPTVAEWAALAAEARGWTGRILTLPDARCPPACRVGVRGDRPVVLDSRRIREELGYREAVPRREAVRAAVTWEAENPAPGPPPDYASEDAALAP
ncbi:MAG: NAD-dependent epimerase/dehydratase family protein [Planctomycetales bacterium]|nr:NAD-dependent epimerase/dehydratase family protein [Planctomycetales bacterium]